MAKITITIQIDTETNSVSVDTKETQPASTNPFENPECVEGKFYRESNHISKIIKYTKQTKNKCYEYLIQHPFYRNAVLGDVDFNKTIIYNDSKCTEIFYQPTN
jgi:hypothetical protein